THCLCTYITCILAPGTYLLRVYRSEPLHPFPLLKRYPRYPGGAPIECMFYALCSNSMILRILFSRSRHSALDPPPATTHNLLRHSICSLLTMFLRENTPNQHLTCPPSSS